MIQKLLKSNKMSKFNSISKNKRIILLFFNLKNEVNDSILKTIQGLHVELKITQKIYHGLVMTLT